MRNILLWIKTLVRKNPEATFLAVLAVVAWVMLSLFFGAVIGSVVVLVSFVVVGIGLATMFGYSISSIFWIMLAALFALAFLIELVASLVHLIVDDGEPMSSEVLIFFAIVFTILVVALIIWFFEIMTKPKDIISEELDGVTDTISQQEVVSNNDKSSDCREEMVNEVKEKIKADVR